MSSITLTRLWIHDAADLAQYVIVDVNELKPTLALTGRFVSLAGGRQRLITTAARSRSLPLSLELVPAADVAQLEAWAGRLLLVRAPHGLLMYGAFLGLEPTWRSADEAETMTLVVTLISHEIEV
jgi:hypothetical protein